MGSDWSNLRQYRKDDLARLIVSIHAASVTARPERDEFRSGHDAALLALCLAVGIDARAVGLWPTGHMIGAGESPQW